MTLRMKAVIKKSGTNFFQGFVNVAVSLKKHQLTLYKTVALETLDNYQKTSLIEIISGG